MGQSWKRVWHGFWQLADPKIWIASTIPMLVAAALAYSYDATSFSLVWFLIACSGIYLIEIGKNAVNECIDFMTGVDTFIEDDKRNPFSGGKKTIVDGKLTMMETMLISVFTLSGSLLVGVIVAFFKEPGILWIGLAGGLLAVFYSLPPLKLNYNGWGEVAVGTAFGPLLMSGMYIMLTGTLHWEVVVTGLPLGFLITNVLWINQYPDFEADLKGGKRNWLVRIGKEKGIKVYIALYAASYLSTIGLAIIYADPWWLLGFLTVPLAMLTVKTAGRYYDDMSKFLSANARTVQIYVLIGVTMIIAALV